MILFVHGLGSCGWGTKSLLLRRHFGLENLLAPDLPFHPRAAVDFLSDLCERYPIDVLIGSSLGGFYATCVNHVTRSRARPSILINPVVRPDRLLDQYRGHQQRWCDGQPFDVGDRELSELRQLLPPRPMADERYLVLLKQGDEVLDYREAAAFYGRVQLDVRAGGDHRFGDLENYLPRIDDWMQTQGIEHA